jgi:hypothetical protein
VKSESPAPTNNVDVLQLLATRIGAVADRVDATMEDINQYTPLVVSKSLLQSAVATVGHGAQFDEPHEVAGAMHKMMPVADRRPSITELPDYLQEKTVPSSTRVQYRQDEHSYSKYFASSASSVHSSYAAEENNVSTLSTTGHQPGVSTATNPTDVADLDKRIQALQSFLVRTMEENHRYVGNEAVCQYFY